MVCFCEGSKLGRKKKKDKSLYHRVRREMGVLTRGIRNFIKGKLH